MKTKKSSSTLADVRLVDKLIAVGLLSFIICNVLYDFAPSFLSSINEDAWYIGQSFAFLCYAAALFVTRRDKFWPKILLAVVAGQFLDEFFGDPTAPNLLEYVGLFILIIASGLKSLMDKIKTWATI